VRNGTIEIIGIILIATILSSLFSIIGADPLHDGIMFKTAFDLVHGKTLYTETYTHYGIITALIQWLSLKFFGNFILSLRIIMHFLRFSAGILYLIWLRFLRKIGSFFNCLWFYCPLSEFFILGAMFMLCFSP
jgi:hypothetical protein